MPIELDNPEVLNDTITKIDLDSTTLDWENTTLHLAYNELADDDRVIRAGSMLSIDGEGYLAFLNDLATRLGLPLPTVVSGFRQACLQSIVSETGKAGTLSD